MARPSLRLRLTLAVVAITATALLATAWGLFATVRRETRAQHDRALAGRARALAALVEYDRGYEFELAAADAAGLGVAGDGVYFELWRPDGTVLARSRSLGARDLPRDTGPRDAPRFADLTLPDGGAGRVVGLRFAARADGEDEDEGDDGDAADDAPGARPPEQVTLVLAESTADVRATIARVRRWVIALSALAVALAALAATWVIAAGLRPLRRLADQLDRIDADHLDTRLPADDQPAELRPLVGKLDELLARLDASFARERRFTADVSHELRTPLAALRTTLEVSALRERDGDTYRRTITDATALVVRLAALVDNLLTLARLDADAGAGAGALPREPVPLRALVEDCWRSHAPRAAARGLRFEDRIAPDRTVATHPDTLRLIVDNLLANAAEYTEPGGEVVVDGGAGATIVDVTDSGPSLSADELARVFDRMWRAEAARSGGAHAGIGLALVKVACAALGHDVSARTLDDGRVSFRVTARDDAASLDGRDA